MMTDVFSSVANGAGVVGTNGDVSQPYSLSMMQT
tara:strand:+ start:131 stop:232 length:102 start_codon:yes stop_codon:yes gene_type:complete